MQTSSAQNSYLEHALSINMRTSSGDIISLDFLNEKSVSSSMQKDENSTKSKFSFSSLEIFKFKYEGNGLDTQDMREIEEFMKMAKPNIDRFMSGVSKGFAEKIGLNSLAREVVGEIKPLRSIEDKNLKNLANTQMVKLFDDSIKNYKDTQELISRSIKFLERILEEMNRGTTNIYA